MQRRILTVALLAAAMSATWAANKQPTLDDAQRAYHSGQFGRSLAMYEALAARHNAEAAECAGFMLLMGEPMYGPQVRRDVERAKEFLVQAAAAGRGGAGFLLNMVERTD